jgi:hypothetical protein
MRSFYRVCLSHRWRDFWRTEHCAFKECTAKFWLATAIANAVWLLGDAVGHIRQITLNNNHASNNSVICLVTEIIMPLVILSLALYHRRRR